MTDYGPTELSAGPTSHDPRFQAIWTQLRKLWATQDTGTPEDIDREHTVLTTLVAEWQKHNEP